MNSSQHRPDSAFESDSDMIHPDPQWIFEKDMVERVRRPAPLGDPHVAARAEVRGYRTSLEKLRKEIKAPALARCNAIDTEAKGGGVRWYELEVARDRWQPAKPA